MLNFPSAGADTRTGINSRPRSILAILLEFDTWDSARAWSYASSYALIDGFEANGCETIVLPSLHTGMAGDTLNPSNPWVDARDQLIGGRTFDQAWVWITHSYYTPEFWDWLSEVAPIRVAVVMESLRYTQQEVETEELPRYARRRALVLGELAHFTHVLSYDEVDVSDIQEQTKLPTLLAKTMLPPELTLDLEAPRGEHPVFLGSLYQTRRNFLNACKLNPPLAILSPPENQTNLPQLFNNAHVAYGKDLIRTRGTPKLVGSYAGTLRELRRHALKLTYQAYRVGFANVNLPALFKGFNGRVIESFAAATPLITPRLSGRPESDSMFADGRELLYYDASDPDDLGRAIRRLAGNASLREQLVECGRKTVRERMSSTRQIAELLAWVEATRTLPQTILDRPYSAYGSRSGRELVRREVYLRATLGLALPIGRPIRVLEIGSDVGIETSILADAIATSSPFGGRVICADTWSDEVNARFLDAVETIGLIVPIEARFGDVTEILASLPDSSFDLVYLRRNECFSVAYADLQQACRLSYEGGIISGRGLDLQVGDFDLESAIVHREESVAISADGREYSPGMTLAAFAIFGRRIVSTEGFWAVRKTGGTFTEISVPDHIAQNTATINELDHSWNRACSASY